MGQSSPEGIILGKGSKLESLDLSINQEKVLTIKQQERSYSEEEVWKLVNKLKETLEEVNQSHVEQNKYMFIDKNFIIWLFNNYKKNNGTLFYHKFDNSNVKTYYYLEDLLKIYNEKS